MALGVIYMVVKDEERATKLLMKLRPQAMPHTGLVRMFDSALGSDPDFIDGLELFD